MLIASGALAVGLGGQLQDNMTIPGTESQEGLDTLEQRFPELAGTSGQVLFVAPQGERITAYDGQVVLVVNTASKCGFTPQYQGLQTLQDEFAGQGFTVLGFTALAIVFVTERGKLFRRS